MSPDAKKCYAVKTSHRNFAAVRRGAHRPPSPAVLGMPTEHHFIDFKVIFAEIQNCHFKVQRISCFGRPSSHAQTQLTFSAFREASPGPRHRRTTKGVSLEGHSAHRGHTAVLSPCRRNIKQPKQSRLGFCKQPLSCKVFAGHFLEHQEHSRACSDDIHYTA